MSNRRLRRSRFAACATLLLGLASAAPLLGQTADDALLDEVPVPELYGRVTDQTGTLGSGEIASLESLLADYESRSGSQIVVLIVPTTGLETIEQYAIRVAEAWRIGRTNVDDGVILLIAKNDRRVRIEVGYGLEGALPDARAKRIISDHIVPRFREGEFYRGITDGLAGILAAIRNEPLPEPAAEQADPGEALGGGFQMIVFFGAFIIGGILRAFRFMTRLFIGAGLGFVIFVLGLVLSLAFSSALFYGGVAFMISVLGIMPGGRGGGGFSGGGFSGGGGGGFSGGGGGFGGGGASGSW
ncbi:MAG: YgcG family protein [bacterium]|nr:YgcG family protein [bacterium]